MNAITHSAIVAGVAIFAGALLLSLLLRRQAVPPLTQPISSYITGPYGWLTTAGFAGMLGALWLLGYAEPGPLWTWTVPLFVSSVALAGVAATKWGQLAVPTTSITHSDLEDLHILCAALAFGGVTVAELHSTVGAGFTWAPWSAVILVLIFTLLKWSNTTLLEWSYTALIVTWFGCLLRYPIT